MQRAKPVPNVDECYHHSGNVVLDGLLGAHIHSYPSTEDESGADRALDYACTAWVLAAVGATCALYLFIFDTALEDWVTDSRLSDRPGNPKILDIIVSCTGILVLLEAGRSANR